MTLLVNYTLKSPEDHDGLKTAMETLVTGLHGEGIAPVHYSAFATDDPSRFVGLLEFADAAGKERFMASPAFAAYRETVGDLLTGPPDATPLVPIASTRI